MARSRTCILIQHLIIGLLVAIETKHVMRKMNKILLTLCLSVPSGCSHFDRSTQTNTAKQAPAFTTTSARTPASQPDSRCNKIKLTPEECANSGTHSYNFNTQFSCISAIVSSPEKFIINFSKASAELNRIEPRSQSWSRRYTRSSTNTYMLSVTTDDSGSPLEEPVNITVVFSIDGFTMLSSANADTCGKYIRTLRR